MCHENFKSLVKNATKLSYRGNLQSVLRCDFPLRIRRGLAKPGVRKSDHKTDIACYGKSLGLRYGRLQRSGAPWNAHRGLFGSMFSKYG